MGEIIFIISCAASYDSCSNCGGGTCTSSCISNCSDICVDNSCSGRCRYNAYSGCRSCTLTCIGSSYVYGCNGTCSGDCGSSDCKNSCKTLCHIHTACNGLATTIIFYITFNTIMIS